MDKDGRGRPAGGLDLYRRVFDTANVGIWVVDEHGCTMVANAKMAKVLGYPADGLGDLSLFEVLEDHGDGGLAATVARWCEIDQVECGLIRKDGSRAWVGIRAAPIYHGGRYLGLNCVVEDVSARKRVEVLLHQREQQLAEAQRVARLGSWEWDVREDKVTCSDELYRMYGLRPEEFEPSYQGFLELTHPEDRAMVQKETEAAFAGRDSFAFDFRIVRPGGELAWFGSRGEVERDVSGAPLRIRGTALDITESKRVEAALRNASARYQLLRAMASAANEAASLEEVLQVALEEICGYTGWTAGHAYLRAEGAVDGLALTPIWHVSRPERLGALRTACEENRLRDLAGLSRQVVLSGAPAWVAHLDDRSTSCSGAAGTTDVRIEGAFAFPVVVAGDVVSVLEFFDDHPVEPDSTFIETMSEVGTQLGRVAERERASAELAAARDAAMEASRLKSEFLATMSHEIRTPMNGVIGLSGLLMGTDLDARQRQYADGVRAAGETLLAVINDILDFSKIEAGRMDLEEVDFDLLGVVEGVAELLAGTAREKGLELVAACQPGLLTAVRGDPVRLGQVLTNLGSNALKFTERGEVVIRADTEQDGAGGVVARFEVVDTGIGITPPDRKRLFQPFSQVDASTTRRYGGTGLGLAISRQLVAAMGGELGVDSEPGRGSTFWFRVPLRRAAEARAVAPVPPLLEGRRVLVVDDNATNRLILCEQLAAWKMRPTVADSGPAALRQLAAAAAAGESFEMALLDMCMPEINGLELARRISADPCLAATRLVLLTSATHVEPDRATQAGLVACLTKPVRQSQLHDCLVQAAASSTTAGDRQPPAVLLPPPAPAMEGKVLVVEDNPVNQLVALGILEQLGCDADLAANGLEAVKALARNDYRAVFMDCQMPGMDGYQATGEIRRRENGTRHLPIIAMTASAVKGDRERCLEAGMDDYISKPVESQEVAAALRRWLPDFNSPAGPEGPSAAQTIDQGRLAVLRGLNPADPSLLARMVKAFLAEAATLLAGLKASVDAGDSTGVQASAHRLKGSALSLGVTTVSVLAQRIEASAAAGSLADVPALLGRLDVEVRYAASALQGAMER